MELVQYIRLFKRWFWVILLGAFVAGSVSFITQTTQPPQYRAQVLIAIGSFIQSPNPNTAEIRTGIDLAQTYAQLVRTRDVLQGVVDTLNLSFSSQRLDSMVTTRILPNTSLLEISVTYTDPILAADMANELSQQLILTSPTNLTQEQQTQVDLLNEQIASQAEELRELRARLREIDNSLQLAETSEARELLRNQRITAVNQVNQTSANIAQFTNTIATLQERTNSLEIVQTADIPTSTVGAGLLSTVLLGTMTGAALAFGGVLLYEYLNDRIRSTDELTFLLNVPVLGVISRFGGKSAKYKEQLVTHRPEHSRTIEEYRTFRTNLLYTSDRQNRVYLISSASPQEGKSVTSANLAASIALSGLQVLLVDADLRRPRIHEIFGLDNKIGLTTLLTGRFSEDDKSQAFNAESWREFLQETTIPNLRVITSGFTPQNSTELLGSALMKRWIKAFREALDVDVVIFDSPPVLALSDSSVLAVTTDAQVVLLVKAGETRRNVAYKAKARFDQVQASVVGTVLNNANPQDEDYYGYSYAYYYTSP